MGTATLAGAKLGDVREAVSPSLVATARAGNPNNLGVLP